MKKNRLACILLPALLGLALLACADAEPTPGSLTLTVKAEPQQTPTPRYLPGATHTPAAAGDPFTATLTPEATFVPLPPSTPNADGTTPTPPPPRATPHPSPDTTAEPLPEKVLMGTVTAEKAVLRSRRDEKSSGRAVLYFGNAVRLLEERDGWYRVECGNAVGWIDKSKIEIAEVPVTEAAHTVVRVGSLNIHSCRNRADLTVMAEAIYAADLDVIGLQEVTLYDSADWLQILAGEAEYPYTYFSQTMALKGGGYGIAIMSRYPILYAETFPLDRYRGDEPRVMQHVILLTEDGIIHFFNTHISAKEMYIKSYNLASMVWFIRAVGAESLFVTGDFNCGPPRLIEFWPDVHFSNMTVNTYGDGSVPKILDNVLYTGRIRVVHVDYTPLPEITDHVLVAAELIYE